MLGAGFALVYLDEPKQFLSWIVDIINETGLVKHLKDILLANPIGSLTGILQQGVKWIVGTFKMN